MTTGSALPRSGRDLVATAPAEASAARRRLWWWPALGTTAAAASAAGLGLTLDQAYPGDQATAQMLRGFDLVTLLAVVPVLGLVLPAARRGALLGRLLVTSFAAYLAYTYAYHLFGTGFNDLLLLHAAVFSGSLVTLLLSLAWLDRTEVAAGFGPDTRARTVAAVLAVLGLSLGALWVYACLAYAVTGDVPAGSVLVETVTVVHLGIALDLTLLVPLYVAAAVLLWRRAAWGYVLGCVALVAGTLHQVSYLVALLFQYDAGVPGAVPLDPAEPVILLLYLAATVLLLRGVARQPATGRPVPHRPAKRGA